MHNTPKQDGLAKLGRNLDSGSHSKLDPVIGRNKEIQETSNLVVRK